MVVLVVVVVVRSGCVCDVQVKKAFAAEE